MTFKVISVPKAVDVEGIDVETQKPTMGKMTFFDWLLGCVDNNTSRSTGRPALRKSFSLGDCIQAAKDAKAKEIWLSKADYETLEGVLDTTDYKIGTMRKYGRTFLTAVDNPRDEVALPQGRRGKRGKKGKKGKKRRKGKR